MRTGDIHTFVAAAEVGDNVTGSRTLPCDAADVAAAAGRHGWCIGRSAWSRSSSCWRRRFACRSCRCNVAFRFHAQGLTNADGVVGQVIPCTQIVLGNVVAFGDVVNGITTNNGMCRCIYINRRIRRRVSAGAAAVVRWSRCTCRRSVWSICRWAGVGIVRRCTVRIVSGRACC